MMPQKISYKRSSAILASTLEQGFARRKMNLAIVEQKQTVVVRSPIMERNSDGVSCMSGDRGSVGR